MKPITYAVVGSGWRAMFYVRAALRYPELFKLSFILCRTSEKAERLHKEYGVPVTTSPEEVERSRPDFVVIAVNKDSAAWVAMEWLERGFPILCETPAGDMTDELLDLWKYYDRGAMIQIAEQYTRYPLIAAGLAAINDGRLGEPQAVSLSLAHDYHAASLIRHMLRLGLDVNDRLPEFRLRGKQYIFPVEETDSRAGPITDGSLRERALVRVNMDFEGGKTAFYDFDGVQYHSFIRSRHINVRCERGEWNDTLLRYTNASHSPVVEKLTCRIAPTYAALRTPKLVKLSQEWQPFVHMETIQDEYAVASLLLDMGKYVRDEGPDVYPLAEALEDAYTWLLIKKALETPGLPIPSAPRPWQGK